MPKIKEISVIKAKRYTEPPMEVVERLFNGDYEQAKKEWQWYEDFMTELNAKGEI